VIRSRRSGSGCAEAFSSVRADRRDRCRSTKEIDQGAFNSGTRRLPPLPSRPFIRPMWHPRSPKDIMAPATVARNRSATDTLERVTELSPTLFDLGTRADAENRFPDESMRLLVEAGVARAPLPRALGGDELDARALVA